MTAVDRRALARLARRALQVVLLCCALLSVVTAIRPDGARAAEVPGVAWQGTNPYIFAIGDSLLEQCRQEFGMGWRSLGYIGWPGATSADMRGRLDGTGTG